MLIRKSRKVFALAQLSGFLSTCLAVAVTLSACSKPTISTRFQTGLSAQQRTMAAELPIYRDTLAEGTYRLVQPVSGLSCQVSADERYRASEENAIEELRRAAIAAGGNAVMELECVQSESRRGPRNCFRSFECRGKAIRRLGTPEQ